MRHAASTCLLTLALLGSAGCSASQTEGPAVGVNPDDAERPEGATEAVAAGRPPNPGSSPEEPEVWVGPDDGLQIASGPLSQVPVSRPFTCFGPDISPPLLIRGVPADAAFLAVVMDDPDAPGGTFTHWQLSNLPTDLEFLDADTVPDGAVVGGNDFGDDGYAGPCPPASETHPYVYSLYALSEQVTPPDPAAVEDVRAAYEAVALERVDLVVEVSG